MTCVGEAGGSASTGQDGNEAVDHSRRFPRHPRSGAAFSLLCLAIAACAGHVTPSGTPETASPVIARPDAPARTNSTLSTSVAQRRANMQRILDAYRKHSTAPGAVLAAYFADGTTIAIASGLADREHGTPMPADGRMLASGAAKTFFAALAVELAGEGRLNLDTPITAYLRGAPWLHRLPHADKVTSRMLMLHTSGYGSYSDAFYDSLGKDPLRPREHLEILKSL